MLFSCSGEYRATASKPFFGQFQKRNSRKLSAAEGKKRGLGAFRGLQSLSFVTTMSLTYALHRLNLS